MMGFAVSGNPFPCGGHPVGPPYFHCCRRCCGVVVSPRPPGVAQVGRVVATYRKRSGRSAGLADRGGRFTLPAAALWGVASPAVLPRVGLVYSIDPPVFYPRLAVVHREWRRSGVLLRPTGSGPGAQPAWRIGAGGSHYRRPPCGASRLQLSCPASGSFTRLTLRSGRPRSSSTSACSSWSTPWPRSVCRSGVWSTSTSSVWGLRARARAPRPSRVLRVLRSRRGMARLRARGRATLRC